MPKVHKQEFKIEQGRSVSLFGEGFKAGLSKTKGWFQRVFTGTNIKQADGTTANVTSSTKRLRFGNWYSEKVVDSKTGAIIHQCEEPLDVHQRHGSDKPELRAAREAERLKAKGK